MYRHFALCGSAWAAIWGPLFQIAFANKQKRSSDMSTFYDCVSFFVFNRFCWGVSQKCFWSAWDYSRPILDHFGSILDQYRLQSNSYKKNYKKPSLLSPNGAVMYSSWWRMYSSFRRSCLNPILELCRTRRKRLENPLFRNGSRTTWHIDKIHMWNKCLPY